MSDPAHKVKLIFKSLRVDGKPVLVHYQGVVLVPVVTRVKGKCGRCMRAVPKKTKAFRPIKDTVSFPRYRRLCMACLEELEHFTTDE